MAELNEVESKALTIIDQAKAVVITDSETYTKAGVLWKAIKDMKQEVADTFDGIIKKAHDAHKEALAQKAKYYDPLDKAYKNVKKLMSDYDAEQERIRKAEEDRLREIARKAEQERLEAERKAEEERLLNEAIKAEANGNKEEAKAILETPVYVEPSFTPEPVVTKTVPKLQGGPVYRTVWKYRITNETAIPRAYLTPDTVKIGGVVRAMKGNTNIPGILAYEERC